MPEFQPVTTGRIWRGAMVGTGVWGQVQLAAWAQVPNARIVALCDQQPDRLRAAAERTGITETYEAVEALLARPDLDFVDLCTRPESHAALIRLVAGHGKPILCQKPLCTSLDEARAAVGFAAEAGVRLMVNENWRWQAWFRQVKACLAQGMVGRPFLVRLHKRVRMTLPRFENPQTYLAKMPRLLLYEMGVHYLDTLRYLFGEPEHVYAQRHHISPHVAGEDVLAMMLDYGDLTALVTISWASVPMPGLDLPDPPAPWPAPGLLEIDGTHGTLVLAADGRLRVQTDTNQQCWHFAEDVLAASRVAALQHFVDCLEQGGEFETSGAETLKTLALVYAGYRSAERGQAIPVERA